MFSASMAGSRHIWVGAVPCRTIEAMAIFALCCIIPEALSKEGDSKVLSVTKNGLVLEMEKPYDVAVGCPLALQVTLSNRSKQPVRFLADRTIRPYGRFLKLIMEDERGAVPPLTDKGERYINGMEGPKKPVWLQPGKTVKYWLPLSDLFRLTPGKYRFP